MAKPLVTEAMVFTAATELQAQGRTPSILQVQAHLGMGSFTTIKRYLDSWHAQQAEPVLAEAPPALAEEGTRFVRTLWATAQTLASEQVAQVQAAAAQQVAAALTAQAEAEAAVVRLETEGEAREQALDEHRREAARLGRLLLEAQAQAEVAAQQVAAARAELARQEEHGRREVAQLAEAVTALQAQVTALVAQGKGA
ncbi:hypothetical protein A9Q02_17645 [Candidatus Chloroploca asiatica]|uniref:KfrA N-terminal DNA-binding domain-containing protein n=2 Tax=Candidatus Chloroploca asiatica TaxID=1506545 RepID=A0A2H3KIU9_9CHLR|nr:hypothetical protein A9Q02_17645 [Candidatus Chloroploca asiatica]